MHLVTPPGVFRPRSDSWQLARAVADSVRPGDDALDLCTGSGLVAAAAARSGARVWAVDVSARAVWTARLNGALHGVRIRARRGSLFEPFGDRRFDLISANPPYLPGISGSTVAHSLCRAIDGGPDGRAILDRIIDQAPRHLRPGGRLLVIHSSVCGISTTMERMRAAGLEPQIVQRTTGPLGPLLRQRTEQLQQAGLLAAGDREEVIAIFRGTVR